MNDTTSESSSDAADVTAADGTETVAEGAKASQSVAEILSATLGKSFNSDEVALKAVKDTFSFVGKAGSYQKHMKVLKEKLATDEQGVLNYLEGVATQKSMDTTETTAAAPSGDGLNEKLSRIEAQLEESQFFGEKPELKEYRDVLLAMRGTSGKPLTEIAENPAFKGVIEKARAHDETEKSRSVLHSNPRLGVAKDTLTQAAEAKASGDIHTAQALSVKAVLESM